MVEYLNAPEDVGMGAPSYAKRHKGSLTGSGCLKWTMSREEKWTARQYAEECVKFAREMRLADPDIELMMAAYTYSPELLPDMLEIAGKDIQYVIYRQGDPDFVHKILPVIREYNRKNGTYLKLVNTEWLPSCHSPEPFENPAMPQDFRWHGEVTK